MSCPDCRTCANAVEARRQVYGAPDRSGALQTTSIRKSSTLRANLFKSVKATVR